jgi:hypothetical protein
VIGLRRRRGRAPAGRGSACYCGFRQAAGGRARPIEATLSRYRDLS